MTKPRRSRFLRGAFVVVLCTGAAFLGVGRWEPRWDVALLALLFVLGWIPGALGTLAVSIPYLVTHHDGWNGAAAVAVLIGTAAPVAQVLRAPFPTDQSPRRRATRLVVLAAIAAVSSFPQLAVQHGRWTTASWSREYVHAAIGVLVVATVVWLPRRREGRTGIALPTAVLFSSFLLLLITAGVWSGQDERALRSIADSASFGFLSSVSDELNVIRTKAETSARDQFTPANFRDALQTVVFGHEEITSATLLQLGSDSRVKNLTTSSDYGQGFDDSLASWLRSQPSSVFGSAALDGSLSFVGLHSLPVVNGDLHPQLVYAVGLAERGAFRPDTPTLMITTLSVPLVLSKSLATALGNSDQIATTIFLVNEHDSTPVWTSTTQSAFQGAFPLLDPVPRTDDRTIAATATVTVDTLALDFVVRRGEKFGTPLTTRRLLSLIEILGGLVAFGVLLQLASERSRRDEERQHREALLSAALEGTPGWTAVIDSSDRVLVGNKFPLGAPQGGKLVDAELLQGSDANTEKALRLVSRARQGQADSITITTPSGDDPQSLRIYEVLAHYVSDATKDDLVFVQFIDVTERRELAMRTAQAERMESIGVLAGSLAHDFNNLLFITQGYLQMMERQPAVANDPQLNRFVSKASDAVQRGATIAKSLLAVARSQPMSAVPINMSQFVADLDPLVQQALGDSPSITLSVEIISDHLDVLVDPGRLSSAVLNLVFNARDAMVDGGALTIHVERTMATDTAGDVRDVVAIAVSDTGKGMSPEVAARAYEPFFTTGKVGKGTGLGLAAVYSFAQQSGGWTTIESREGVGTTVSIFLKPAIDPAASGAPGVPLTGARLRALVVDDEESLADLVGAWLAEFGFETRLATSSNEALSIAREFRPHLLVSDSNLGETIDGAELAAQITSDLPTLVTVFMTGFSDRLLALETVGALTLAKPFSKEDLNAALVKVLGAQLAAGSSNAGEPA